MGFCSDAFAKDDYVTSPKENSSSQPPSKNTSKTPSPQKDLPVHISADHMIHLAKKNLVKAKGRVFVRYGKRTVKAQEMILNTETGKGQAKGKVIMTDEDGSVLKAKRANFNMKSQKGQLFNVKGKLGDQYYVTGEKFNKLSKDRYQTEKATLTTCTGKLPDWIIEVNEADIKLEDRALFKGGVLKVRDIPILYLPIGYVPISTQRKSGFLTPKIGVGNLDGFLIGNRYYWAINQWSDATIGADYMTERGVRGSLEYRYTPSKTTKGQFKGIILDDNRTGELFWKVDGTHNQQLPKGFQLNAKLDQTSKANFNKTFRNATESRTRRSSDSFLSLFGRRDNHSFDILARFRESEEETRDDTYGILPGATFKTQPLELGNLGIYFNQDTSYNQFLVDLDTNSNNDELDTIHRIDFHPQIALPLNIAPWMQFTTRLGFRGTYYNKEVNFNNLTQMKSEGGSFVRELFDLAAVLEGPKFNRIFSIKNTGYQFKHVIEPRIQYDFIPDMDGDDRNRIRIIDAVDAFGETNRVTYFLTQRLLQKVTKKSGSSEVQQIARFEISQSYDFLEASRMETPLTPRRPFSNLRFDFDSRFLKYFMFNFDTTFNFYDGVVETFNFDIGIRPSKWVMLILERRHIHNQSASILGTIDLNIPHGWNFKYSARYDEFNERFLEHNARLTFNNLCECWGFAVDFINRKNINGSVNTTETKVLFSIQLRGLGNLNGARGESFIHRTF